MRTRTALVQTCRNPAPVEATASERIVDRLDVTGTICGFRTPDDARGIGLTGYNLHFVDDHRRYGGHVLDFTLARGQPRSTRCPLCTVAAALRKLPQLDLGGDRIDEVDRSERSPDTTGGA